MRCALWCGLHQTVLCVVRCALCVVRCVLCVVRCVLCVVCCAMCVVCLQSNDDRVVLIFHSSITWFCHNRVFQTRNLQEDVFLFSSYLYMGKGLGLGYHTHTHTYTHTHTHSHTLTQPQRITHSRSIPNPKVKAKVFFEDGKRDMSSWRLWVWKTRLRQNQQATHHNL